MFITAEGLNECFSYKDATGREQETTLPGILGRGGESARCEFTSTTETLRNNSSIDGSGSK